MSVRVTNRFKKSVMLTVGGAAVVVVVLAPLLVLVVGGVVDLQPSRIARSGWWRSYCPAPA